MGRTVSGLPKDRGAHSLTLTLSLSMMFSISAYPSSTDIIYLFIYFAVALLALLKQCLPYTYPKADFCSVWTGGQQGEGQEATGFGFVPSTKPPGLGIYSYLLNEMMHVCVSMCICVV